MLPKSTIEYGMCATISQSSRPTSNDLLRMWPVSKRVNVSRRGSDDPNLVEPVEDEANAVGRPYAGDTPKRTPCREKS